MDLSNMNNLKSIWSIDGILTGTKTPGLSGLGNNDSEGVLTLVRYPEMETIWWSLMLYLGFSYGVGSYSFVVCVF